MAEATWNPEGLSPEALEAAREAARRSGLSVGEWLNTVIRESATGKADSGFPQSMQDSAPSHTAGLEGLQTRLEQLSSQLGRFAPNSAPSPADSAASDPQQAVRPQEVTQALERINKRLDVMTHKGHVDTTGLEQHITAVDQALNEREPARTHSATAPRPAAASVSNGRKLSLDDAIAQIAARQRALDGEDASDRPVAPAPRPSTSPVPRVYADDRLAGLEDRLHKLSQQLDSLGSNKMFEQAVLALHEELTDISRKITDAAPRRALEAIETQVHALGERIDQGRERALDLGALAGIERGLDQVREVLHTLAPAESLTEVREEIHALHAKIETLAMSDSATLRQLQASVADLRAVAGRAASGEALIVLAEEVQILGDRIDRFVGPSADNRDTLAHLDRRIGELTDAVNQQRDAAPSIITNNLASIVDTLSRKLDQAVASRDQAGFEDISHQLNRLSARLEAADARLGNLDSIESGLSDLFQQVDHFRETAVTAARAASEVAAARGQPREGDVDAIKHDLQSLRDNHRVTEQRTQDTLEAVHDTLERMVERLAMVEKARPAETPRRPAEIDPEQSREALTRSPLSALRAPPTVPRENPPAFEARPADQAAGIVSLPPNTNAVAERRPIDPSLPADTPLEPGSRTRAPASAAERIAASEAVLGETPAEPDSKANFIAAARRAAQAAANMSGPSPEQADVPKPGPSRLGALAQKFSAKRLMMLSLALFVAGGSAHILINLYPPAEIWHAANTQVASLKKTLLADPAAKPVTQTAAVGEPQRAADEPATTGTVAAAPASKPAPAAAPAQPTERTAEIAPPPPSASAPAAAPLDPKATPTVSPLTIASIKLPAEPSASASKGTSFNQVPAQLPASEREADPHQLPAAFGAGLKAAALAENPAAEYEIGLRFAEGRGVPINLEEAARWLERAANRDIAPAQYRLGSLYEKGQGVKKNLEKARRLYRSAADRGNAKAMHNLAVMHAEGMDGKPDFKSASQWFRRAAEHGVSDSQYNLGIMFARGLGIEQNLSESYKWFALAGAQGDAEAGKKRDEVAARLDKQALAIANLAVQSFTAEPQPEDAISVKAPAEGWDKAYASPSRGKGKPAAATTTRRPGSGS